MSNARTNGKTRPATPLSLVPPRISEDTVECLEDLLEQARKGEVIGIAYAAMFRGRKYLVDATGETDRNPKFARGLVAELDDYLGRWD